MDAVEYVKAHAHMCSSHPCNNCPIGKEIESRNSRSCNEFKRLYPKRCVEIVEDYWKENKPKTNAEWVKEMLEEIGYEVDTTRLKRLCPPTKSTLFVADRNCKGGLRCKECDNGGMNSTRRRKHGKKRQSLKRG